MNPLALLALLLTLHQASKYASAARFHEQSEEESKKYRSLRSQERRLESLRPTNLEYPIDIQQMFMHPDALANTPLAPMYRGVFNRVKELDI